MRAERIDPVAWDEMVAINPTGAFTCAQLAGRYMIERGRSGSDVLTGSTGSLVAFESLPGYGAAKAGLDHAVRHLAAEWGRHDIRVNFIAPGHMTSHMRGSSECHDDAEHGTGVLAPAPLGREGAPEELVGPVVFLASDASSYAAGHVIPVDGSCCVP